MLKLKWNKKFVVVVIVSYHMCNVLVADFTEKVKFAKDCALENIQCLNHQKRL